MNQIIKLETINFAELVKNNTLSLSLEAQSDMINLLNTEFTKEQSKRYIINLYMYLNFHPTNNFPINLDQVYKDLGFANKENAKRTIKSNFTKDDDYKILLVPKDEQVKTNGGAGLNKEDIMLNVDTYKTLCMLVKTPQGKEIRKYYVKLENIYNGIIKKEIEHHKLIQENTQKLLDYKEIELIQNRQDLLLNNFDKKSVVYLIKITINNKIYYKFGYTDNIKRRLQEHLREINDNIQLICCIESKNNTLLEQKLKDYLKTTNYRKEEKINEKLQTELIQIDDISIIEIELNKLNKDIEENKEHLEIRKLELELEILKLKLQIDNNIKNSKIKNEKQCSYIILNNSNEKVKDDLKKNIETDDLIEYIDKKVDEHIETELEMKMKNFKGISIKKYKNNKIKYQASFTFENKRYYCGTFDTKIEAGLSYNKKAIEICGDQAIINEIPEELKNLIPVKKILPVIPESFKSNYFGVTVKRNKYCANFRLQGKYYYCGTYDNEIEAALAYNLKIKELCGENFRKNKINIIPEEIYEQYPNFQIKINEKIPKQNNAIKKYIGVIYQSNKFRARFTFNKKFYNVGSFDTEIEAVKAYNKKVLEICGDKAKSKLNIID